MHQLNARLPLLCFTTPTRLLTHPMKDLCSKVLRDQRYKTKPKILHVLNASFTFRASDLSLNQENRWWPKYLVDHRKNSFLYVSCSFKNLHFMRNLTCQVIGCWNMLLAFAFKWNTTLTALHSVNSTCPLYTLPPQRIVLNDMIFVGAVSRKTNTAASSLFQDHDPSSPVLWHSSTTWHFSSITLLPYPLIYFW